MTVPSFHSCTPLFVLTEEKDESILSPLTGLATSISFKICPVSRLFCSPQCCTEVREEELCQIWNRFSLFLSLCFLGIKGHVLDSKAGAEVGGRRAVCCNTMNEQERNLGDWQRDTWNILHGLTNLVVVRPSLSFNTRAGTWLYSAQTPWNAHAALVTDSQNTSGSHFFEMSGGPPTYFMQPPLPHPQPKTFVFSL